MLIGSPSAPRLIAEAEDDLVSLRFYIFPPMYAAPCVLHYNVSQVTSDSVRTVLMVDAEGGQLINQTMGMYNLCTDELDFFATPFTGTGAGEASDIFSHPPLDLAGTV